MANAIALRAPLPLTKSGGNPTVKAAIGIVYGAITRAAKTLKSPAAWTAFWTGLQAICTRNLADAPLPLTKSGGNPTVKAAIGIVYGAITRATKTLKSPAAWTAFWTGLQAICSRNLAEAEGTGGASGGGTPAPAMTTGKPPATARTVAPTKAVAKRIHRKTAGVVA
jgi:hypothetical protein